MRNAHLWAHPHLASATATVHASRRAPAAKKCGPLMQGSNRWGPWVGVKFWPPLTFDCFTRLIFDLRRPPVRLGQWQMCGRPRDAIPVRGSRRRCTQNKHITQQHINTTKQHITTKTNNHNNKSQHNKQQTGSRRRCTRAWGTTAAPSCPSPRALSFFFF